MKNYDNQNVRRQDRLLSEDSAEELLKKGEYGVLSLVGNDFGYGLPMSYVWDGGSKIFFHCAPEGQKIEFIKKRPKVSFVVVGHTNVIPNKFTTEYESVMIFGEIAIIDSDQTKIEALELFVSKYSPDDTKMGAMYAQKSLDRTTVLCLEIHRVSGKAKNIGGR